MIHNIEPSTIGLASCHFRRFTFHRNWIAIGISAGETPFSSEERHVTRLNAIDRIEHHLSFERKHRFKSFSNSR
jgi:hypothetical protein